MADIRTLKLALLADTKDFIKGLDKADKESRSFSDKLGTALKTGALAFAALGAAAGAMAIKIGKDAIGAASDFSEEISKAKVIFGDASKDIEEMRDSLRVAMAQYAQAIPALAAQGQDPSQIVSRIAEVIKGRQKGKQLETIVDEVFAPEPQPEVPMMGEEVPAAGMAPVPASQPTPEQMGAAPAAGSRPDIASLLASIAG